MLSVKVRAQHQLVALFLLSSAFALGENLEKWPLYRYLSTHDMIAVSLTLFD